MQTMANQKRSYIYFVVGDWVLLKLQPYCQHSLDTTPSQKLRRHFHGPYHIHRHIGEVTYDLELFPSSQVHLIFHVSLL